MQERHHLTSLGRHLHRSVVRTCLPAQALQQALHPAPPDALVETAAAAIADATEHADALHQTLDRLHHDALRRFEAARNADELRALWRDALGSPDMPGAYWALLTHPLADRALRHLAFGDVAMLGMTQQQSEAAPPLHRLLGRRSVSPRRLTLPAPPAEHLDLMLQAALSAPDHGRLRPWRVIEFRPPVREPLADLFEAEKRRRDPLAGPADLRRAREHATQAPCLLGFVVSLRQRKRVPLREQWLSAGAALGNLLNAAHELGYGAMVLSGDRCFDAQVGAELGLAAGEFLVGFVSIGCIVEPAPEAARPLAQSVWSCWSPGAGPRAPAARPAPFAFDTSDEDIG